MAKLTIRKNPDLLEISLEISLEQMIRIIVMLRVFLGA